MERYRAESPLQVAERRVREIEARIAELKKLSIHTRSNGYDTSALEPLFEAFWHSLELAQDRVEIEKKIAENWRQLAVWPGPDRRRHRRRV